MPSQAASVGSEAVTHEFRVTVQPRYLPDDSEPDNGRYLFAYTVRITNESSAPGQLLSRHWIIVDADGQREDIEGDGVVGRMPLIMPGQTYEYSSFCPLPTPWGTMEGSYRMLRDDGEPFTIGIARFYLVASEQPHEPAMSR